MGREGADRRSSNGNVSGTSRGTVTQLGRCGGVGWLAMLASTKGDAVRGSMSASPRAQRANLSQEKTWQ